MFLIEIVTLYRLMDKVMNKVTQKKDIVDVFSFLGWSLLQGK